MAERLSELRAELSPLLNLMVTYADARVDRAMGFGVPDGLVTDAMRAFTNQLARADRAAERLQNSSEGQSA